MEDGRKRHCWECLRRSLVCDSVQPACKRCTSLGVECPGYGSVKPKRLKWITPGRVASRPRRLKKDVRSRRASNNSEAGSKQLALILPNPVVVSRLEADPNASALFEAAEYFNACIFEDLVPLTQLGPNPNIYPISATILRQSRSLPDYLRLGMVCMVLCHRMNRTRDKALAEKFYLYRGMAIRSLNDTLTMEHKRTDDTLLTGVLTVLLVDAQHGVPLAWRWHLEGLGKLIALRGGFDALVRSKRLEPLLVSLWSVAIFGNTTCPASDLVMTDTHMEALGKLSECSATLPFQVCPPSLFAEVIRISYIRKQANDDPFAVEGFATEAYEILNRIYNFSTAEWAASKPAGKELWGLIGHAYGAAVELYCILSLQSVGVLPDTPALRDGRDALRRQLGVVLGEALPSPAIQRSMFWPLMVLGVAAASGGGHVLRAFVAEQMSELSRHVGVYSPLVAKDVLEAFWSSGQTRWDACFDKPYVLTTQIAVDTRGILPSP